MEAGVPQPSTRDTRDAQLAAVLAQAVRDGRLLDVDALRVIKHELRRRNTNKKSTLLYRSTEAQRVIDHYGRQGLPVPKNDSPDALHADHVYELGAEHLHETHTVDAWHVLLTRARTVVAVTASENYRLEQLERGGVLGPAKYAAAGVTWAVEVPPFVQADDVS